MQTLNRKWVQNVKPSQTWAVYCISSAKAFHGRTSVYVHMKAAYYAERQSMKCMQYRSGSTDVGRHGNRCPAGWQQHQQPKPKHRRSIARRSYNELPENISDRFIHARSSHDPSVKCTHAYRARRYTGRPSAIACRLREDTPRNTTSKLTRLSRNKHAGIDALSSTASYGKLN